MLFKMQRIVSIRLSKTGRVLQREVAAIQLRSPQVLITAHGRSGAGAMRGRYHVAPGDD